MLNMHSIIITKSINLSVVLIIGVSALQAILHASRYIIGLFVKKHKTITL